MVSVLAFVGSMVALTFSGDRVGADVAGNLMIGAVEFGLGSSDTAVMVQSSSSPVQQPQEYSSLNSASGCTHCESPFTQTATKGFSGVLRAHGTR